MIIPVYLRAPKEKIGLCVGVVRAVPHNYVNGQPITLRLNQNNRLLSEPSTEFTEEVITLQIEKIPVAGNNELWIAVHTVGMNAYVAASVWWEAFRNNSGELK